MPIENTRKEMCCCCMEITCGMRTLMVIYILCLLPYGSEAWNLFEFGVTVWGLMWLLHFLPIMYMSYWMYTNWCGKKDNFESRTRIYYAFAAHAAIATIVNIIRIVAILAILGNHAFLR